MRPATPIDTSPAPESRRLAILAVAAGVALLAVMVVPFPAAGLWPGSGYADVSALSSATARGLVRSWEAGSPDMDPGLAAAAAFWARFHVVKAVLALPLLVTAVLLGRGLWRECVRSVGRGRRARFAAAGVLEAPLVLLAVLLVVANVQGALVPLSSALGLVDVRSPDPAVATAVHGITDSLETSVAATAPPVVLRLVEDFAAYHLVMVGLGAVVTAGLALVGARLWRRASDSRPARSVRRGGAAVALVVAASFALITAANLSTAIHPTPALRGFFQGAA